MRIKLNKIICATDFSELSNHAVFYGAFLAKEYNAELYLCHVIDLSSATMYGEGAKQIKGKRLGERVVSVSGHDGCGSGDRNGRGAGTRAFCIRESFSGAGAPGPLRG